MTRETALEVLREDSAQEFESLLKRKSMLRRDEVEVLEYNKKEEMAEIDERLVLVRDEKKRSFAAFGQLIAERQNVFISVMS